MVVNRALNLLGNDYLELLNMGHRLILKITLNNSRKTQNRVKHFIEKVLNIDILLSFAHIKNSTTNIQQDFA